MFRNPFYLFVLESDDFVKKFKKNESSFTHCIYLLGCIEEVQGVSSNLLNDISVQKCFSYETQGGIGI
jgi:hypothetical protein